MPIADRGLVLKFATIGLWSVLFAAFLPDLYRTIPFASTVITLLAVLTAAGALIAILGLIRRDNLVTEATGLCLLITGPVGYLVLVGIAGTAQAIQTGVTDRIAVIAVALLQVEVVGTRLAFLVDRRRAVKHDDVPEVSE